MIEVLSHISAEDKQHCVACLSRLLGDETDELRAAVTQVAQLVTLESDDVLFRQNEPADCMYIVVRGRLRVTVEQADGLSSIVNEVVRDQSVGEMGMFTSEPRSATGTAIRNSLLLRISSADFENLTERFPKFALKFSRQVIERFSRSIRGGPARLSPATNIAVVKTAAGTDLDTFMPPLMAALDKQGSTLQLAEADLGANERAHLSAWLDDREETHDFIVLRADDPQAEWARTVIQNADKVLLVTSPEDPALLDQSQIDWLDGTSADCLWVLMHPEHTTYQTNAFDRLGATQCAHVHVRRDRQQDLNRLGRFIGGQASGLVLSGGGARGLAHIGAVRALEESGEVIDLVGGTSIGAVIAALIAMGLAAKEIETHCRRVFTDKKLLADYTLPKQALLKGRNLDRACQSFFGDRNIEDLWLNYFCMSADLRTSSAHAHTRGALWQAVRASVSLPGILPPVSADGRLLVDGGVLNNLPVDVMRTLRVGHITAIDIDLDDGPADQQESIRTILLKSALLSSRQRQTANSHLSDRYIRLPLGGFGLLDWQSFDEIVEAGYRATKKLLE
jgi:predicted acylesterase/phospholipase RssA/CRP-like cAMP-binding protein